MTLKLVQSPSTFAQKTWSQVDPASPIQGSTGVQDSPDDIDLRPFGNRNVPSGNLT